MGEVARFNVRAQRWLRERRVGDQDVATFTVDQMGLMVDPGSSEVDEGWRRAADAAGQGGGFVVLGEPGAGKTTELEALIPEGEQDEPSPGQPGTLRLRGPDLMSVEVATRRIEPYLAALSTAGSEDEPPTAVRIVIDQLDECPFVGTFHVWLKDLLRDKDVRGLRIWLACRVADYSDRITSVLAERLSGCFVGELAPLSSADVATLVASAGLDADAFLREVEATSTGGLAGVPLTLKMLASSFADDDGHLNSDPKELFNSGVRLLATEHDPDGDRKPPQSTLEQRLAVAGRIAAHLVLSNRQAVDIRNSASLVDLAVPLGELVGAHEWAGAGEFEVTTPMVQETLKTGLFTRQSHQATFGHSSLRAFLAGRHLADRVRASPPMPARQLEELFLVTAPDDDATGVPEHLRETAAWLVAHAPGQTSWLAAADPDAFSAHSASITDADVRHLLVEGLLNRAEQIEMSSRVWQSTRWRLDHPGLPAQIAAAIQSTTGADSTHWPTHARTRLAIRIARDSAQPDTADPLAQVVEDSARPVGLRSSAASAALAVDPDEATAARLRQVLLSIPPPTAPWQNVQPDDPLELAGTLLNLLWPRYLTFDQAKPYFQPVARGNYLGTFRFWVSSFSTRARDADLHAMLDLVQAVIQHAGATGDLPAELSAFHDWDDDHEIKPEQAPHLTRARIGTLKDIAVAVAERALASPQAMNLADQVASTLLWFVVKAERPPLPEAIILINEDGSEPDSVRELRLRLAGAMLHAAEHAPASQRSAWIQRIAASWGRSLDTWRGHEVTPPRRGPRARLLDHKDLPWLHSQIETLGSHTSIAQVYREVLQWCQPPVMGVEPDLPEPWKDAEAFQQQQRDLLDRAVDGDTQAFWVLYHRLHYDPSTGHPKSQNSWLWEELLGATLWPPATYVDKVTAACQVYLTSEDDHRAEWLGKGGDRRAEAGFAALTHLHTHADHLLDSLDESTWANWTGAIVSEAGRFEGHANDPGQALVTRAAAHASAALNKSIDGFVRSHLAHNETSPLLPQLPPTSAHVLTRLAEDLITDLTTQSTTPDTPYTEPEGDAQSFLALPAKTNRSIGIATLADLLSQAVTHSTAAEELARKALQHEPGPEDAVPVQVAAVAARSLLTSDPTGNWPAIKTHIDRNPEFGRAIINFLRNRSTPAITAKLDEPTLAAVYRWLISIFPADKPIPQSGFVVHTAAYEAHDWRGSIAAALAAYGTDDALSQLRALVTDFPDEFHLNTALQDARRQAHIRHSARLSPDHVNALLSDSTRRIVNDTAQLAQVLIDTLNDIQLDLHTHYNLLWDGQPIPKSRGRYDWRPKTEGQIGAYLTHELTLRLAQRGTIVNREVVIRPTDQGDSGERPDIKIDVIGKPLARSHGEHLTIPIELKGPWHRDVLTSQEEQLADQYMTDTRTADGIYIVAWYRLDHWTAKDSRRPIASKHVSAQDLKSKLHAQATQIAAKHKGRTHPFVIEIEVSAPRPK
ncbi:hypothetical protein [Actinokineospora pegani]|uniref:hypothetical protein n=1 Tax=Actinokineospora pegani TaxID=2654637 RepID=UPI0012EAF74F|nr:hypothetical protein [Actinokineospora pegani]